MLELALQATCFEENSSAPGWTGATGEFFCSHTTHGCAVSEVMLESIERENTVIAVHLDIEVGVQK